MSKASPGERPSRLQPARSQGAKPLGAHVTLPCDQDAGQGNRVFHVFPAGFGPMCLFSARPPQSTLV
jgi:hypothetical protein